MMPLNFLTRPLAAVPLLLSLFSAPVTAAVYSNIFIFGDSLSDTGNAFIATGGTQVAPPYFNGRLSNGPIWVDTLAAQYMGLPTPAPSFAGGNNYAVGTAQTGGGIPSLTYQAGAYALSRGNFSAADLVVVWGGANDLISGATDPSLSLANVSGVINTLANKGAQTILLVNLPDLGDTPRVRALGAMAIAGATGFSQAFNVGLTAGIPGLESAHPGLDILMLDVFTLGKEIQANSAGFGFTNTTRSALADGVTSGAGYAYFDDLHPTSAVHSLFAQRAATLLAVPEPSAAGLLLFSGLTVIFRRRRQR